MTDSTTQFSCTIPGPAQEQTRPRIVRKGPRSGLADTDAVRNYKAYAKTHISQAWRNKPPIDAPVSMLIDVFVRKPPSWPKKRIHAATKPDADNYAKLICDCCDGLVYTNDSRIIDLRVRKHLSDTPRVEIRVDEVNADVPDAAARQGG